jgi:hypothetical protein
MKVVQGGAIGLFVGIVFGLVWHTFDQSLALYFWPALGALAFGQHAYHSSRDKKGPEPPTESS